MKNLVPALQLPGRPAPAAKACAEFSTRNPKPRSWITERIDTGAKRLVPARRICAAWVPASTYRAAGPCQKRSGLVLFGTVKICGHHAAELDRKGLLDLGAGVRLEERR